ncbi:MAG TPA: C25 family cysteine peptidase [Thermoanaerobaculaceae bacterium]|nr:C25 family cysteine peptidase [Thermoanaerobaculaceae bacterium]HRS15935.1 C25 family cysteine peptidase [Thermoanaerobaculaceae bacterium]
MHRTENGFGTLLGLLSVAACRLVLAIPQVYAGPAPESPTTPHGAVWEAWQPLGGGFMGRRRVPARLELPAAERRSPATQERVKADHDVRPWEQLSVWLYTEPAGLYGVAIAELARATGADASGLRAAAKSGRLSFANAGEGVSWYYDVAGDRLVFAGETYRTFHAEGNAYQLRQTQTPDPFCMSERHSPKPPAITGRETPFEEVLHFEEETDMMYVLWLEPSNPDSRYWFWDYLYGSYRPQIQVPLAVPDPAPEGKARLRVRLHGFTDLYPGNDHRVVAELNGVRLDTVAEWDGLRPAELVADFDQQLLAASGYNVLTLISAWDSSRSRPGQLLESIEIAYARQPVAKNGQLWLHNTPRGAQLVTGFASPDIVVIESPVRGGVVRRDVAVRPHGSGWAVAFEAEGRSDYLVAETSALAAPVLDARTQANLTAADNRADYLIIAAREFPDTAAALATYRQATHGVVKVVWLDDIYKSFSFGRVDPFAIGRFMTQVRERWSLVPSVVTLLGKGSLDRKDRMGYGDGFLPVLMTSNPWALATSDARLLGIDGGAPSMAYGRLPITNDAEGLAYVDKLMAHERRVPSGSPQRAIVAADDPDAAGDFHADATRLAAQLRSLGFDHVDTVLHPNHPVRQTLTRSDSWEASVVTYSGHGSQRQLGTNREKFLSAEDALALNNSSFPVFGALTCAAGADALPGTRSLAATLVLNPRGGAIASLAPSGNSSNTDAHDLARAFFEHLIGGRQPVGTALAGAASDVGSRIGAYMVPMYTVTGDPAAAAR